MGNLTPTPQAESAIYQRIRRIGKIGRLICSVLLVLAAGAFSVFVVLLLCGNADVDNIKIGSFLLVAHQQISTLPWLAKAGVVLAGLIFGVYEMAGIWIMRRLFILFVQGEVFSRRAARLILWLGVWSMVNAIPFHLSLLLSGLFLLSLGWVMELAVALKHEQDLTV